MRVGAHLDGELMLRGVSHVERGWDSKVDATRSRKGEKAGIRKVKRLQEAFASTLDFFAWHTKRSYGTAISINLVINREFPTMFAVMTCLTLFC